MVFLSVSGYFSSPLFFSQAFAQAPTQPSQVEDQAGRNTQTQQLGSELTIKVVNGQVQLETRRTDMSPEELAAIRSYIERRVVNTPFAQGGNLQVTLKDETLQEIKSRLNQINLATADEAQVDRALQLVWRDLANNQSIAVGTSSGEGESDSARILIGQNFSVGPNEIHESIVAVGSTGRVSGRVENLVIIGSDVEVDDTAQVTESLVVVGSQVNISPNAQISGEEVRVALPASWGALGAPAWRQWEAPVQGGWAGQLIWAFISWLATFALGALYIYLFPQFHARARQYLVERKGASFGLGVLGYLSVAPIIFLLVITLVGILLVPVFIFICIALVAIGQVTVAGTIGERFKTSLASSPFWALAIGLLILRAVGLIPFFGGLAVLIGTTMGLGAVIRVLFERYQLHRKRPKRPTPGSSQAQTDQQVESGYAPT